MDNPSNTPRPDTVVPFATFIEVRQRRLRVAAELLRPNVAVDGGDPEKPEPPTNDAEAVRIARAAAAPHSDR